MISKKLISAAVISGVLAASVSAPALADNWSHPRGNGAIAAGVVVAAALGAALANSSNRNSAPAQTYYQPAPQQYYQAPQQTYYNDAQPAYAASTYYQPAPQPVYYQPAPQAVYYAPAPVYYAQPRAVISISSGYRGHHGRW